jgi:phosphatidylinositol-4-phosphate 3-kinase
LSQELGFGIISLFDFKQRLVQSQYLIPLWMNSNDFSIESDKKLINSMCFEKTNPIIHLVFPEYDFEIRFPQIISQEQELDNKRRERLNSLDSATQTELFQLLNRNPLEPMSCGEKEQLWDRRYYLMDCSQALPKVLLSSHSWEFSALSQIYSMVDNWTQLSALESIQLLMSSFPDIFLRQKTIKWLKKLSLDQLCDFLPQLVQSLRYLLLININYY